MVTPMLNVAHVLTLGTVPPVFLVGNELVGEGLRVDWTIEKAAGPAPDTATIRIYNLGLVQRKAVEAASLLYGKFLVSLSIGWGAMAEIVFTGVAYKVIATEKTGTDIITTIEAADGYELRDTPPVGGALVGAAAGAILQQLLAAMQVPPSPPALLAVEAAAAQLPIPAWNVTGEGTVREQLDALIDTLGLSWGIADGFFVVYQNGLRNDLPPSILNPFSGLLDARVVDDGGVEFEALAQARTVPGMQIVINMLEPIGGGPLRVERVVFNGSSFGPSFMSGTARKVALL